MRASHQGKATGLKAEFLWEKQGEKASMFGGETNICQIRSVSFGAGSGMTLNVEFML